VVATLLTGRLLDGRDPDTILYALLAGLGATALVCLALPEAPLGQPPERKASPGPLLRNPVFVLFLLTAAVLQPSHAVLYGFGTLHWRALGHSGEVIGFLWVLGVAGEIALFAFGRRLADRLGAARLLLLSASAGMLRWAVLAEAESLPVIAAAQILHGLTFGCSHLGAMRFILEAVPTSHSATGQTLYSGVAIGLGFGILLALSGPLYDAAGGRAYLAMSVLCALAAAGALLLSRRWRPGEVLVLA
jgi:PPP family 3-phenylpropionic acid transporter